MAVMLFGCAGNRQMAVKSDLTLQELLKAYPAENEIEGKLLNQALLGFGVEGLAEAAKGLDTDDWTAKNQSKYALNGAANYIGKYGDRQNRQNLIDVITNYLKASHSVENKRFVIRQLLPIAGDDLVGKLNPYLSDPELFDYVVEVYRQIDNDMAAKALASYLNAEKNSDKEKVACIKTIGELKYKPAASKIIAFAGDKNSSVRDAALFSLANMGYQPAGKLYLNEIKKRQNAYDKDLIASEYLRLAENLPYKEAKKILIEIISEDRGDFGINHKLSALSIMADNEGAKLNTKLLTLFDGVDFEYREGILKIAEGLPGAEVTMAWIDKAASENGRTKGEIIAMLGRRGDKSAASLAVKGLSDTSPDVVMASIPAVFSLQKDNAADKLIDLLVKTEDKAIVNEVLVWLNTLSNDVLYPYINKNMTGFTPVVQVAVLETLAKRNARDMQDFVVDQLKSTDANVRIAALRTLKKIAAPDKFDLVLSYLVKTTDAKEKRETRSLLVTLAKAGNRDEAVAKVISALNADKSAENNETIFYILKNLGGAKAFAYVLQETNNKNAEVKDLAMRTLYDWPESEALDPLMTIAAKNRNEQARVLAMRAVLRLLRDNNLGDLVELEYYNNLLNSTKDVELKKQIIIDMANLKTYGSLNYVASKVNDKELGLAASTTAMRIASDEKDKTSLKGEDIAFAIIEANAHKELKAELHQYRRENEGLREPPEGFTYLFNEKDLKGWKGLVANPPKRAAMTPEELKKAQEEADKLMRKHWKVMDGILYFDGAGSHLCTVKDYRDFEMYVDWKIEKDGDSGIYLRGAPQVQIWDPANGEMRSVGSGGLYNNKIHEDKPLVKADNPIGEWNTFHIIMKGERVTVYLNDRLVVNNVIMENYWERDKPIYPIGQIELQSHHTPLYFRNIFIKELNPPAEALFDGMLFNGKNLEGWEIVGNGKWTAENGILSTNGGGGGWISTTRQFSDFKLELEFRVPENGNSGVFLRTPRKGNPAYVGMEIQVLDDYGSEYTKLQPWQYTGSVYNVQAPSKRATKHAGEWQKMEITCVGPHVKVVVNGVEVNNVNLIDYMEELKKHPGIKRRKGYIGLQNHSTKIEYRNIYLKEL
jgi:HEAT repeat protein